MDTLHPGHPLRNKWVRLLGAAFVNSETGLIVNRFALGLAEGGVLTCTIVLIRGWFTRAERAHATTLFMASTAVADSRARSPGWARPNAAN